MNIHIFVLYVFIHTSSSLNLNRVNNLLLPENKYVQYDIDVAKKEYFYRLETPDGTVKHEKGYFKTDALGEESLVVEGGFEFIADNGLRVSVSYIADENGYRPNIVYGSLFPIHGGGGIITGNEPLGLIGGGGGGIGGGVGEKPSEGEKDFDIDQRCKLLGCGARKREIKIGF